MEFQTFLTLQRVMHVVRYEGKYWNIRITLSTRHTQLYLPEDGCNFYPKHVGIIETSCANS